MARIKRVVVSNYPHHVTQRGVRSMIIFRHEKDRMNYLQLMVEETERFGVEILAWCLMSNHVHLIAVPRDEYALAKAIGNAHKRYTRMRNFEEGVRGYLFQGRFGSCVMNERYLIAAVRYVERNPVRAKMVKEAWEYPWSSAAFHIGKKESDALVTNRDLSGLVKDWKDYLHNEDKESEERLRLGTRTGRPVEGIKLLYEVKKLTGRDIEKKKAGRPKKMLKNK